MSQKRQTRSNSKSSTGTNVEKSPTSLPRTKKLSRSNSEEGKIADGEIDMLKGELNALKAQLKQHQQDTGQRISLLMKEATVNTLKTI